MQQVKRRKFRVSYSPGSAEALLGEVEESKATFLRNIFAEIIKVGSCMPKL